MYTVYRRNANHGIHDTVYNMQKVFVGVSPVAKRSALATGQAGGFRKKTIFVGLSGGVDSAVSAALLKERGFDVVCVFIKIWQPEFLECNWKEERVDAMRIAVALGLPFREVDLSDDYKRSVVDTMVKAYASGITPNPDVLCNRAIKFGSFLKIAKDSGADFIATGHYAQIRKSGTQFELLRGCDSAKDQSYFLHLLDQRDLAATIFPVGNLLKSEVRKLAHRFKLPVAQKPDSQGLCFVGDVTLKDFLRRYIHLEKGVVSDADGSTIGEHEGAALYTIGQRHGFSLTNKSISAGRHFITAINVSSNTIQVSANLKDAMKERVSIKDMHWISGSPPMLANLQVQARYREKPVQATLAISGNVAEVSFREPHLASAGQSLVVYDGDRCLGGGIISRE